VIGKISAVFESYWNHEDFELYEREAFLRHTEAARNDGATLRLPPTELRAEPFQERLLEQIALSRELGHHHNLLVSATGTGKTVMAALDYARLRPSLSRARLLFVAHRQEILQQSADTFRMALREPTFGELWVGGQRPERFEHVFASIQSLQATGLAHIEPDRFDVVIVDEFHHAAAASYRALLEHVKPRELLGLTATPERSDGLPVLDWFGGRIAAELRLWDAIEQHRLVPFVYYGIHDGLDLRDVPWRRGRGYDVEALSNLLTANDVWARMVLQELAKRVDDPGRMRALGFCVSVAHARFMARVFQEAGVNARAIWSDTSEEDRTRALADLAAGVEVNVVFTVDLFNEGVDVPAVDTLLMLRPTESPTLFLQQLGRGLRRSHGKTVCTVLDFVGRHRAEFRFDRRFGALLGGGRRELESQVKAGFPFLPAGCHMELDHVASKIVLASLESAIPSKWKGKVDELRRLAAATGSCSLREYLEGTGLSLEDVYVSGKSWSDLLAHAGLGVRPSGPREIELRRACRRLLHVDDLERIAAYRDVLIAQAVPEPARLSEAKRRLLRMLVAAVVDRAITKGTSLEGGLALLWEHQQVRVELLELLDVLAGRIEHVSRDLGDPEVPLRVHARYTRIEILAAFGLGHGAKVAPWQTGIYWAERAKADLLAFTLDKTTGQFSPTTRYRDYAISRELIHWESQSITRADSETGLRYQHHESRGSRIMLFARLRSSDRAFYFLGPASYESHESEQPMAITWRLAHPLPGDLFAAFAAAVS
jgi:superfamily II DNA or RNA helicase